MAHHEKYRKTFFFLEGISFLILFQTFWTDRNFASILPLALLIIGYKVDPVRRLSWFVMVFFSLYLIFLSPSSINGYILGLCGIYILFNTSLLRTRALFFSTSTLTLLFLVQFAGVYFNEAQAVQALPKVILNDGIIALLSVIFRSKFMGVIPREESLPILEISQDKYSDREIALLRLVWDGKTAKEIASELELSDGTVRTLLSRLYSKIGVLGIKELYSLQFNHKIVWS